MCDQGSAGVGIRWEAILSAGSGELRLSTSPLALTAEALALRDAYAALNRNDIEVFGGLFDPHIEHREPDGCPGGGTHRGRAAVPALLALQRGNWAEGACEPERFVVAGERMTVSAVVRVRSKDETAWREGRVADVVTFRDGKVTHWRTFAEERQAFAWVGIVVPAPV